MHVRLRLPAIAIVTRARGLSGSAERAALLDRLTAAASAGATMVHIRERQLDDRQLLEFIQQVIVAVTPAGTRVVVNERTDLALAAGADGVHLKSDAVPAEDVRGLVPPPFIVGRSVHSEREAQWVAGSGACDYLLFGTVFRSRSKPDDHPVAGIEALERVCRSVSTPVLAIGGVSIERAAAVAAAGAAGIAAISMFSEAGDVDSTVRALRDALTVPRRQV
jgi:thiamine-phosphate diphosphorylase